jgi:hypothetical protein
MKIADLNIDRLSGPVSFVLLKPTQKLQKLLGKNHEALLMLIGDYHRSFEEICEQLDNYKTDPTMLSIVTDDWFRLLNNVSSEEHPIDYYVEVSLDFKKMSSQEYKQMVNKQYDELAPGVMHYLIKHHFECFYSTPTIALDQKPECFTKHLRYHSVDPRSSMYTSDCIEALFVSQVKKCLSDFLSETIWINYKSTETKLDFIKLLELATTNIGEFWKVLISLIFTMKKQSCVWKQIQKLNIVDDPEEQHLEKWIKFCELYFETADIFVHSVCPDFNDLQQRMRTYIHKYREKVEYYRSTRSSRNEYSKADQIHSEQIVWSPQEQDFILNFCTQLFSPLLDLYFMLRMWKTVEPTKGRNSNPSWLNVLNAGNAHIDRLTFFLVKRAKLYEFASTGCKGIIGKKELEFNKHTFTFKTIDEAEDPDDLEPLRCLNIQKCQVNLDDFNPNIEQIRVQKYRQKVLGLTIYKQTLLTGIKQTQLIQAIKQYLINHKQPLSLIQKVKKAMGW